MLLQNDAKQKAALEAAKKIIGGHRETFDSFDKAMEKAAAAAEASTVKDESTGEVIASLPVVFAGIGSVDDLESHIEEHGAIDWGLPVGVSLLGVKLTVEGEEKKVSGARAIVVYPIPTLDDFLADQQGRGLLDKIVEKEVSHVAFRGLRLVENDEHLPQVARNIPTTVNTYASESQAGTAGDTETFKTVWTHLRKQLLETYPVLKGILPPMGDVIRAIRSKSLAEREYMDLESQNLFEFIGQAAIAFADSWEEDGEPSPLDTTAIADWLEKRETTNLGKEKEELKTAIDLSQFKIG